jgi:hypothetical protein
MAREWSIPDKSSHNRWIRISDVRNTPPNLRNKGMFQGFENGSFAPS